MVSSIVLLYSTDSKRILMKEKRGMLELPGKGRHLFGKLFISDVVSHFKKVTGLQPVNIFPRGRIIFKNTNDIVFLFDSSVFEGDSCKKDVVWVKVKDLDYTKLPKHYASWLADLLQGKHVERTIECPFNNMFNFWRDSSVAC